MKEKCFKCKKKVLMIEQCKCNNKYCLNCLPYFEHSCSFDYKEDKKKILTENNQKIEFAKVVEI